MIGAGRQGRSGDRRHPGDGCDHRRPPVGGGRLDRRGGPAYGASKGGLEALTRQLAAEYAEYGIRSNAILLGSISVPRTEALHADPVPAEKSRAGRLIQRVGTPEDVASMVAFLASDEAGF